MSNKNELRVFEMRASLQDDNAVERDEDGVPTAFRIWRAGLNTTDFGENFFTKESAELLLEEQARRGNRYSFDVNHLSLKADAPIENQKSVGSFSIAVRNGELWAVACRWIATTRREHAEGAWLSISPAYDVRADGTIVGLTNCALTGTPATWGSTQLAATRRIAASRTTGTTHDGVQSFPVELLRVCASSEDPEIRNGAFRELTRRDQLATTDPRLERMAIVAGRGAVRGPLVRHEGCRSTFATMTQEQAREHLKKQR